MAGRIVLITGVSGYFGKALARHLLSRKDVSAVVGTDVVPCDIKHKKFSFHLLDAQDAQAHRDLLRRKRVSCVFHLAFIMGEHKDAARVRGVNVRAARALLEAAHSCVSVRRVVFLASVSAYGARPSNPSGIKEDAPLRADTIEYGKNKMLVEKEVARLRPFLREDLELVMLRTCTIVGPSQRDGGAVATFLASPIGFSILGYECPIQFIHERDLLRLFSLVLDAKSFAGVYNVAPKDWTSTRRLSRSLGKPVVYFPYSLLWLVFWLLFKVYPKAGISHNSVSYLAYPIVVDSSRIEKALGFSCEFGSHEAFLDCAKSMGDGSQARS